MQAVDTQQTTCRALALYSQTVSAPGRSRCALIKTDDKTKHFQLPRRCCGSIHTVAVTESCAARPHRMGKVGFGAEVKRPGRVVDPREPPPGVGRVRLGVVEFKRFDWQKEKEVSAALCFCPFAFLKQNLSREKGLPSSLPKETKLDVVACCGSFASAHNEARVNYRARGVE